MKNAIKLFSCIALMMLTINTKAQVIITVNDTAGNTIKIPPVFGVSYNNLDQLTRVETDEVIQSYLKKINIGYWAYGNGSISTDLFLRDVSGKPGSGWNCPAFSDCDLCYTGNRWPAWFDYLFCCQLTNSKAFVTVNVYQYINNTNGFYAMLDTMVSDANKHDVQIGLIMFGAEAHTALSKEQYSDFLKKVLSTTRKKLPATEFVYDTWNNTGWDGKVTPLSEIDATRIYYQVGDGEYQTYELLHQYAMDVASAVRKQEAAFPSFDICISQTAFKSSHPLFATNAMMVYGAELFANIAKESLMGKICYAGEFNAKTLFDNRSLQPISYYYAIAEVSQMFGLTYQSASSSNGLTTIAGKDADGNEKVIVINSDAADVAINKVMLNGRRQKSYSVVTYSGEVAGELVVVDTDNILNGISFSVITF